MEHAHAADRPSVHGMLVFGTERVRLSHLPMFHRPHDFQSLIDVGLSEAGVDVAALYRDDRLRSGERVYTWLPEPFVLPELLASGPGFTMTGTLFRGHFERGGVPVTSGRVRARVERVLFTGRFAPAHRPPVLRYLLLGSAREAFVAHAIARPPDFDHLLQVAVDGAPEAWDGRALALELRGRRDAVEECLREGEVVEAALQSGSGSVRLMVLQQVYLETGDLAE